MWINFSFRKAFWLFFFVFSLIKRDIWTILHKQTHFLVTRSNSPMWREDQITIGIFENLCFQVSFSQNFQLAASLFYSIIRNFSYFRPKGCCCFYPVSCVFLLHMGLLITTYANLVNVWKTSWEAGDQWVNQLTNIENWYKSIKLFLVIIDFCLIFYWFHRLLPYWDQLWLVLIEHTRYKTTSNEHWGRVCSCKVWRS